MCVCVCVCACVCMCVLLQSVLAQYYPTALMSELALYTHKALLDLHNAFPNRTYIEVDNLLNLGQIIECLIQISDTRNR